MFSLASGHQIVSRCKQWDIFLKNGNVARMTWKDRYSSTPIYKMGHSPMKIHWGPP